MNLRNDSPSWRISETQREVILGVAIGYLMAHGIVVFFTYLFGGLRCQGG
jgi:hypothetical protein